MLKGECKCFDFYHQTSNWIFLFWFLKDLKNNTKANINSDEVNEELADFQLSLPLVPDTSSSLSTNVVSTNEVPYQRSSSIPATTPYSSKHTVVLHSNVTNPLLSARDRLHLNFPLDKDNRSHLDRNANSLWTIYSHSSKDKTMINETISKSDAWEIRSPSSDKDLTDIKSAYVSVSETNTNDKEKVTRKKLII